MNLYETQLRLQTVKFEFTESRGKYQAELMSNLIQIMTPVSVYLTLAERKVI